MRGGCCALFSQWSTGVSQQHGIFNFTATDHCENGLRFFSQWSGWVAAGFERWRKTGFVIGPARKAKIETQRTLRTQRKTVRSRTERDASLGLHVQFPLQRRSENSYSSGPWVLRPGSQQHTGVPLTPLREKSGTRIAPAAQALAASRVNVVDHCATFFGDLARGSPEADHATKRTKT
jgi:hypothetical protein